MFPGHFPSSPSSAEPASDHLSNKGSQRLATRPLVSGRVAKTPTRFKIRPNHRQSTKGSLVGDHGTSGSFQTLSSSNLVQESISSVSSDSEQTDETPEASRPEMHNKGAYSSPFTSFVCASAQSTLWDVTAPWVSPDQQKSRKMYIYRDPRSTESVYKIGITERPIEERMKEHKNCCGFEGVLVYISGRDIKNCHRLETLIAWDLGDKRIIRPCKNLTVGHNEWFAVDKEMAVKTVKQWEDFMYDDQPYDEGGNLSIVWRYLIQKRSPNAVEIRALYDETRRGRWAAILASPTIQDYAYAYLSHVGSELRRFRGWKPESYWQLSTVVYSLWTLALSRNVVAFYALVIVLGCAGNTLLPKSRFQHKQSRKMRPSPVKRNTPTKNKDQ